MPKTNIIVLLLVTIAAGWLYSYAVQGPGVDREVFRYAGMAVANGETPYTTFFDHKPPLIYFVYLLAHPFGVYGPQIIFTLFTFLVSLMVYRCCRKWVPGQALWLTLLWVGMMHDPLVMADGGQNRLFSALAVTALFSYACIRHNRLQWPLIGLGLFLVGFTQFTDLPALLPLVLFLLLRKKEERNAGTISGRMGLMAIGFLLPALVLLFWLYIHGAASAFLYDAIIFNGKWYIDPSLYGAKIKYIIVLLVKTGYFLPLLLLPLLFRTKYKIQALVILSGAALQALVLIPGYFFNHYFISCIPYSFFGWVLLVAYSSARMAKANRRTAVTAVLLLLTVYYIKPWHWMKNNGAAAGKQMIAQLEPYARSVQNQRGQLFGMDMTSALSLNATYNIISPSRWLYMHFWLRPGWDTALQQFREEVLQPLDRAQCRYILDRDTDIYLWRPDMKNLWTEYLEEKYRVVLFKKDRNGRILYRLWERK